MNQERQYPAYRETKSVALDRVPSHWKFVSVKRVLKTPITDGPHETPKFLSEGIEFLSVDGIQDGELVFDGKRFVSVEDHLRYSKKAKPQLHDVLVAKSASVGKVARVKTDYEFNIWSPLAILRAENSSCLPGFLEQAMKSDVSQDQLKLAGNTNTQANVGMGQLGTVLIPLPPVDEQRTITNRIDRETARIDALIEKKARFIELLKEKRQALLHECLMHHETVRMRVERCTESPYRPINRDDDVSYTRLGLYNRGRGIFHKPEAIGRDLGDSSFTWVHEGDLIVSGQFAWEGAVSLASEGEDGSVISHRYHTYRGKTGVTDTAYLWAYFTSHEGDFVLNDHSRGSAGRNRPLNPNTLAKEKIPVPPMVMQQRVAALVEFENRFKALVARSTALLNERRSALITAAVTGQIDLRGDAA